MIKQLASSALLWAALAGAAAQAQSVLLTAPPPGQTAAVTSVYPAGDALSFIYGPFTAAAGSNAVTYTAANAAAGAPSFESFDNYDGSLDFPVPTQLVATFDSGKPTGPLQIRFRSGVSAFGIQAESEASDLTTFAFTAYDDQQIIGQYTLASVDQTQGKSHSVFLGAQATDGDLITRVDIRSGTNDFYVGPLSIYAVPVPEASALVSCGLLLVLGVGGMLVSARAKSKERV